MVVANQYTTKGEIGSAVYYNGVSVGHVVHVQADGLIHMASAGLVFAIPAAILSNPVPAHPQPKQSEPNKNGDVFPITDIKTLIDVKADVMAAALGVSRAFLEPTMPQYRSYLDQITRKRLSPEATANAAMVARDGHKSFTPQSYIDAKTPPTPKAPQRASVSAAALMTTYSDDPKTGRRHGFSG